MIFRLEAQVIFEPGSGTLYLSWNLTLIDWMDIPFLNVDPCCQRRTKDPCRFASSRSLRGWSFVALRRLLASRGGFVGLFLHFRAEIDVLTTGERVLLTRHFSTRVPRGVTDQQQTGRIQSVGTLLLLHYRFCQTITGVRGAE
jgi:hypothetical protein